MTFPVLQRAPGFISERVSRTRCVFVISICRFVEEYYKENWRGYGGNVVTVFKELKALKYSNPHEPATKQFDGQVGFTRRGNIYENKI